MKEITARPELIDMREASVVLNLGRTKITELVNQGEIPSATIGKKRVFRRRDVDAYIARIFGEAARANGVDG